MTKSFRLRVWAEEAVKSRLMCPDVLPVLMSSLAGLEKAACSQHCDTALTLCCPIKAFYKVPVDMELYLLLPEPLTGHQRRVI